MGCISFAATGDACTSTAPRSIGSQGLGGNSVDRSSPAAVRHVDKRQSFWSRRGFGFRSLVASAVLLAATLGLLASRAHANTTPLAGGATFTGTAGPGTLNPAGRTYSSYKTALSSSSRPTIPVA